MAIINRDVDVSEQIKDFNTAVSLTVGASAGTLFPVFQAPFPATLRNVAVAAGSVSGSPVVSVSVRRFTSGGVTTIAYVGTTLAVTAFGLSAAYQSVSLAGPGTTLAQLQAGDQVCVQAEFAGGNVAAVNSVVTVSVQATQDIVSHFGINSSND